MHSGFIALYLQPLLNSHFAASTVFVFSLVSAPSGSDVDCLESSVPHLCVLRQLSVTASVRVVDNQYIKDQPAEGKMR